MQSIINYLFLIDLLDHTILEVSWCVCSVSENLFILYDSVCENVGTGTGTWSFYEWEYISILLFRDLEFLGTGVHFIFAVQGQGPGVFRNGSHFSLLFRNRDLEFSTKLVQEALAVPEDDGIRTLYIIVTLNNYFMSRSAPL